jgi:hypothetical protein
MSLMQYIRKRNREYREAGIPKVLNIDRLSTDDMQELASRLVVDLEPNTLTNNGKVRGLTLMGKRSILNRAVSELRQMGQPVEIY